MVFSLRSFLFSIHSTYLRLINTLAHKFLDRQVHDHEMSAHQDKLSDARITQTPAKHVPLGQVV